jgi:4-amino-4-deoxy-L-arabinose transferase-like glycosyltransferase
MLGIVFQFTGVSLIAARVLTALCSTATLAAVYLLIRRCTGSDEPALLAVLLLAASPFAFVFSRLAILETPLVMEFSLLMLCASYAAVRRLWLMLALGAGVAIMILTKTTGVLLVPSIVWLAWRAMGGRWMNLLSAAAFIAGIPFILVKAYGALIAELGFGADYKYFFGVNAIDDMDWKNVFSLVQQLFQNCFWVDRLLYPIGILILVSSVVWQRRLWRNPLFTASWIAIATQAAYIVRRQDDYAPRYFLGILAPLVLVTAITFSELALRHKRLAWVMLAAVGAVAAADSAMVIQFITHPTYRFLNAAQSIRATIMSHPEQNQWIFGVSGSQISLMTGLPSINDAYGSDDMAVKVARYKPGWYAVWNTVADENRDLLAPYRLTEAGRWRVFDDDDRNTLILYRMDRQAAGSPQ